MIIKKVLNTEKTTGLKQKENKYVFEVDKNANKIEVKNAVEAMYKVKVIKVNTLIMHGKKRRVRSEIGSKPDWKKAIITLKIGDRIESLE
jgi:large subunit ribosomal protein L23